MVGCILFVMYFMAWIIMGDDLPKWLQVLNYIALVLSTVAASILWEIHKSKVEKLEEEVKRLKDLQNG